MLWKHQQLGIDIAARNARYGFFYDTRTGKTRMALLIAKSKGDTVIIVPPAIIPDWQRDAAALGIQVNVYTGKDRVLGTRGITIINACLISCDPSLLTHWSPQCAILDESSKIKNPKSKLTKAIIKFADRVPSFYCLSATPAPNGYHEYYTQLRCIAPQVFRSYRAFLQKYFVNVSYRPEWPKWQIRSEADLSALKHEISKYAIYVDQQDAIPTTNKIYKEYYFALPDYSEYSRFAKTCVLGENVVQSAATIRIKLQQYTSGFIYDPFVRVHDVRGEALMCVLDECDGQVVIWANFKQEFADIHSRLGASAVVINGDTPNKEQAVQQFVTGKVQYAVCHPLSVGMGKNFTNAHHAVYYSVSDSYEAFKQSCERICGHIDQQPFDTTFHVILAKDTIDEVQYAAVKNKGDASMEVLNYVRKICTA